MAVDSHASNLMTTVAAWCRRSWGTLAAAAALAVAVCLSWSYLGVYAPLLYVVPVTLAAMGSPRISILFWMICTAMAALAVPPAERWSITFLAVPLCYGLVTALVHVIGGVVRKRAHEIVELREEIARLQTEAEEISSLCRTSMAGVLIVGENGAILSANPAAQQLLSRRGEAVQGRPVSTYLPALDGVLRIKRSVPCFRSALEAQVWRAARETVPIQVCFSTFDSSGGPRLGVLLTDLTWSGRAAVAPANVQHAAAQLGPAANLHEIRNACWAAASLCESLINNPALRDIPEVEALYATVRSIAQISADQLLPNNRKPLRRASVREVMTRLDMLLRSSVEAEQVQFTCHVPPEIEYVSADEQELLQVLLNLTNNSLRALHDAPERRLDITVEQRQSRVYIRVSDSGPAQPELSFEPKVTRDGVSGLGLFVSRAILRGCGGNLCQEPTSRGTSLLIEIPAAAESAHAA
ncbi:MAG TPA: ATP-binding protein [Bryobacteraceae bacterium]|nr:ATP-binding protein [Bryobacteraceae bacterium]